MTAIANLRGRDLLDLTHNQVTGLISAQLKDGGSIRIPVADFWKDLGEPTNYFRNTLCSTFLSWWGYYRESYRADAVAAYLSRTGADAHAHIRIYSENEQPDLLTAILLCKTPQELGRLNYLNLERLDVWPMCMSQALLQKKKLLGYSTEEVPAQRTEDDWSVAEIMEEHFAEEDRKYVPTMIVQPARPFTTPTARAPLGRALAAHFSTDYDAR